MKVLTTILIMCFSSVLFSQEVNQDWPNLKRYQEENVKVMEQDATNRVVFMGNSITEGWIQARPSFFEDNPYINRGIGGQTTPQMLVRFRQDVIALNPKVVVILAGTNDIAGNTGPSTLEMILDNLKGMAELADANGIQVILCSVMPAFDYPWKPGMEPNIKIPALNKMIQAYCNEKDFIYLDYFAAMDDGNNGTREELTSDGVHLTEDGYKFIEPMVKMAIGFALSK